MELLNTDNYARGFLVDEDLMAGVSANPEKPGVYVAFVLSHATGEYVGYQPFEDLNLALQAINRIPRTWTYETMGGCGGCGKEGKCGEGGGCGGGQCQIGKKC